MVDDSSSAARPCRKHIRLPVDAYHKPAAWYFVTICCRAKKSLFNSEHLRNLVQNVLLQTAEDYRVELAVYTILPNHLHLICSVGTRGLSGFVQAFKSCVTKKIRSKYKQVSPWQARFFDHKIRSDESLRQKCEYVWMNPVRRGLVRNPEDYPWSGSLLTG